MCLLPKVNFSVRGLLYFTPQFSRYSIDHRVIINLLTTLPSGAPAITNTLYRMLARLPYLGLISDRNWLSSVCSSLGCSSCTALCRLLLDCEVCVGLAAATTGAGLQHLGYDMHYW